MLHPRDTFYREPYLRCSRCGTVYAEARRERWHGRLVGPCTHELTYAAYIDPATGRVLVWWAA